MLRAPVPLFTAVIPLALLVTESDASMVRDVPFSELSAVIPPRVCPSTAPDVVMLRAPVPSLSARIPYTLPVTESDASMVRDVP